PMCSFLFLLLLLPPRPPLFPYTTLFRSDEVEERLVHHDEVQVDQQVQQPDDLAARDVAAVGVVRVADDGDARAAGADEVHERVQDRKSTRLNSSHVKISYAVFCLKKKTK